MKIEEIDGRAVVTLRQSWINDALLCNERGRRNAVDPVETKNDSAFLGTAMHAGAEVALEGHPEDAVAVVEFTLRELIDGGVTRTLNLTDGEMIKLAQRMYRTWEREIYPEVVDTVRHTEATFNVPWFTDGPIEVRLSGTIDAITTEHLWDWKTSGRRYSASEKQKVAVQPTVYAIAADHLGLVPMPMTFKYGVVLREKDEAQIVAVHRNHRHAAWLRQVVTPLVHQGLANMAGPWSVNDDHNLCSAKWCPHWANCKGQFLSIDDLTVL